MAILSQPRSCDAAWFRPEQRDPSAQPGRAPPGRRRQPAMELRHAAGRPADGRAIARARRRSSFEGHGEIFPARAHIRVYPSMSIGVCTLISANPPGRAFHIPTLAAVLQTTSLVGNRTRGALAKRRRSKVLCVPTRRNVSLPSRLLRGVLDRDSSRTSRAAGTAHGASPCRSRTNGRRVRRPAGRQLMDFNGNRNNEPIRGRERSKGPVGQGRPRFEQCFAQFNVRGRFAQNGPVRPRATKR